MITTDLTPITDALQQMDPANHKSEVNKVIFDGLGQVRQEVQKGVKRSIPYTTYPNEHSKRDYHKHGELRGKQYGPLEDDVKRAVSGDNSGGTVSIYSMSHDTRWAVLNWLNVGTLSRTTGGRTKIGKNGKTKFTANGGAMQNRGHITGVNFFLPSAQNGVSRAETQIINGIIQIIQP